VTRTVRALLVALAASILGADLLLLTARITRLALLTAIGGGLAPGRKNVELVGRFTPPDAQIGAFSDVSTLHGYAYLGRFSPGCRGGVYVIDIRRPSTPRQVAFIPAHPGSYVSEGVQVVSLATPAFRGDVLVHNNEVCRDDGRGGISLWDVTNPARPAPLALNVGDDIGGLLPGANQTHSAFAWQQGDRAFVLTVDDVELRDVDLMEITDPRQPRLIAETGHPDWPEVREPLALGQAPFLHDGVARNVKGGWQLLLSYWDAGWVILDIADPAHPRFVKDFDYPDPDPLTHLSPPTGNAHSAEWDRTGRFILGADEDFSPYREREPPQEGRPARLDEPGRRSLPGGANAVFDGWGYVRLLDARTLAQIDAYAIPQALDPTYQFGLQALSVHEVATDPAADVAYLSYYNAGFRVLSFNRRGLREVGHFIDEEGNDFWGVEVARDDGRLVLASDRDRGLYLFRYTGPR
jgi:hypothetical protein